MSFTHDCCWLVPWPLIFKEVSYITPALTGNYETFTRQSDTTIWADRYRITQLQRLRYSFCMRSINVWSRDLFRRCYNLKRNDSGLVNLPFLGRPFVSLGASSHCPATPGQTSAQLMADWQEALKRFNSHNGRMNLGVFDPTMKALARNGQWQWCVHVLEDVKEKKFWPHRVAYGCVTWMDLCSKSCFFREFLGMFIF